MLTDDDIARILNWLEKIGKEGFLNLVIDIQERAINFLAKAPAAREKQKFKSPSERLVLITAALFFAGIAVKSLEELDDDGLLQGGSSYRAMTKWAAHRAFMRMSDHDLINFGVLPDDSNFSDNLDDDSPLRKLHGRWTNMITPSF